MLHEIFENVKKASTKQEKIDILRKNFSPAMKDVLRYALHPNCKFYTNTVPVFKKDDSPEELSFSSLYSEHKRLYVLLDPAIEPLMSGGKTTTIKRKQEILVQMLESINVGEAAIIEWMIEGTFGKMTSITPKLVEEAFPGILK